MNKLGKFLGIFVIYLVMIGIAALVLGFPVKWLWNWVAVDLFAFPRIDFWQALGLNILCGCLFGTRSASSSKSE